MRHHLECPSSFSFAYIQWGSSGQRMVLRKLNIPLQVKEWTCDCVCSTNPVEAHENNPAFVQLLSATSLNGISLHHSPFASFGAFYRNDRTVSQHPPAESTRDKWEIPTRKSLQIKAGHVREQTMLYLIEKTSKIGLFMSGLDLFEI